ncbi:hypothetical protein A9G42_11360 [Gilliamella sp. Nev6-6]|nr:hypothetical protein A9G40_04510 [Gilliamella apicola]OCG73790.1 hypothetical protein A9G42_11360 [Gilliamella apicola]
MMNKEWKPLFQIQLIHVINKLRIHGLHIGAPDSVIYEIMGEPELPTTKLNKKSKIYCHIYGNVTIYSENNIVIAIDIDLHGVRKKIVDFGEVANWKLNDWLALSKQKGWHVNNIYDVIQLEGNGIVIGLSQEGKVGVVSIR